MTGVSPIGGGARRSLYELSLTLRDGDDLTNTITTRSPFMPIAGTLVTLRTSAPGTRGGDSGQSYRVLTTDLFIDEVEGSPETPLVAVECHVEEVDLQSPKSSSDRASPSL